MGTNCVNGALSRLVFHLWSCCSRWQGHTQPCWATSLGLKFTGMWTSIRMPNRCQVFWPFVWMHPFTSPTPTIYVKGQLVSCLPVDPCILFSTSPICFCIRLLNPSQAWTLITKTFAVNNNHLIQGLSTLFFQTPGLVPNFLVILSWLAEFGTKIFSWNLLDLNYCGELMPHVLHRILRYLHDEQDNVALSANGLPVQYLILDLTREFQLHNPCLLPNKHLHFQIVI